MSANRARDSRETVRRKRREHTKENLEFYECIRDIVSHPAVLEMKKYYQHCDTDCYEHCLDVANLQKTGSGCPLSGERRHAPRSVSV